MNRLVLGLAKERKKMKNKELMQQVWSLEDLRMLAYPSIQPDGEITWSCIIQIDNLILVQTICHLSKEIAVKEAKKKLVTLLVKIRSFLQPSHFPYI